jgi:uncharacterized membrane protein
MAKISKSISVNAPVGRVFEYATDPDNLPEIWPSLIEVSHVERKPDGGHDFDWVYKMAGLRFKGHAKTIDVERDKRVVTQNIEGIPSTFRWEYAGDDASTKVRLEVEYTLPGELLERFATPFIEKLNEREAETILDNLKARMEAGLASRIESPAAGAHRRAAGEARRRG